MLSTINSISKAYSLCAIFYLSILSVSTTVTAAQLVDSIPEVLDTKWEVCTHFKTIPSECHKKQLPVDIVRFSDQVIFQTYTKDVIISGELKKSTIGLWLPSLDDVDEVFINNELIGRTGKFLPSFDSGFRYSRLYLVPGDQINYNQFNQIRIKTYSSRQLPGLYTEAPVITDYLNKLKELQSIDYTFIIVASLLLLLCVFQAFYFVMVKDNAETIHFSFFLLAFALISIARSSVPQNLALDLSSVFKLEIFLLNFSIIAYALFIFKFFELELRKIYAAGLILAGCSALVIIVWPFAVNLRFIVEINYWVNVAVGFFVIGSGLIIAAHKQRRYFWLISTTSVFGWLILIYESLMYSPGLLGWKIEIYSQVVPVIATIIGVVISLTLTHKYWRFFKGSTYDHLTGTLLRPTFFQRLSEEMQRSQRGNNQLLIAVIDIQQARRITTNYGYSIGNHLLVTVSNALTKVLRPFDLICRFSEEQFCIAASIVGRQDAESCLKRVYEELISIQQPIEAGVDLYVDARVGGVIYNPDQHLSVSHLLQDANYALSKAKSRTKHNYLLIKNPTVTA
ncbi:diguanylate cyclase [Aliikangiella sp. G2MR2-5]|uniref:GGDEF domain-containing protein n=1 Tax=Aliikangiella sp. G2MR2-5 TaxID=2788943 RepID=UPI0018A939E8|nr:GGDEF domain-containing protein [Aliikangiella sp. G2MR2-5]